MKANPRLAMDQDLLADVARVSRVPAVPTILDVVCRTTGMRFAAVARVTKDHWVTCSVLDAIDFGLKPGDELKVETTICHEIRQSGQAVVIDDVAADPAWCQHATPQMYGFRSYISVPIILADGSFFGTLCAIDPAPANLNRPEVATMFQLFADLVAKHLDAQRALAATESALLEERALAQLREQFIAVLGHDLRTPLVAFKNFSGLLLRMTLPEEAREMTRLMLDSASRMQGMIDNLLDLARGRLGAGLPLSRESNQPLEPLLRTVITELQSKWPDRVVDVHFRLDAPVECDRSRIAQLLSNLVSNALSYGAPDQPVRVDGYTNGGVFSLSVANRGEPIPEAVRVHLFEPFFRNTTHDRDGLGLGLYIAHEIALAHGGVLSVESTPEETCFRFSMPNAAGAALPKLT